MVNQPIRTAGNSIEVSIYRYKRNVHSYGSSTAGLFS